MTVRLSAMFEEHITAIIQNYNIVSKNVTNQPNTRSRRRFSNTEEEEDEETSKESESEEEFTHTKIRKKRKLKSSSSSNQSNDEHSSSESSSSSSSNSDASDSSYNKPLQRTSIMNGHKKQNLNPASDESQDSDYQPLSNLKRKAKSNYDNKKIQYDESSDDSDRDTTINTRTRSTKRKRTVTDSSDSDNVGKSSRDTRSVLVTVSSRGRVRKLTPKVRAYLEK